MKLFSTLLFVLFLMGSTFSISTAQSCGSSVSKKNTKDLLPNVKQRGEVKGGESFQFISPIAVNKNSGTIKIQEKGGEGKTSVTVCKVDKSGKSTKVVTKWFNDSQAKVNNRKEELSINVNDLKDYSLVLQFDGKSVGNTFKFTVKLD